MNLFTYMQKRTLSGILVFAILISPIMPLYHSKAYDMTEGMYDESNCDPLIDPSCNGYSGSYSGSMSDDKTKDLDKTGLETNNIEGGDNNLLAASVFGCGNGPKRFIKSIQDLSSLYDASKVLKKEGLAGGLSPLTDVLGTTAKSALEIKALVKEIEAAKFIADASKLTAQKTSDAETQKLLKLLNSKIDKQLSTAEEKKIWDQCLNGIAYKVTKHQIATMTQKTLNWVNSGFAGDPLFIKDQKTFFKNIETKTMRSILGPISAYHNTDIYPYGQDLAKSMINGFKTTFEDRAKSTLQQSLPQGTSTEDFTNDFSQGGWSAWESFTLNPQNNPLGFQMITSQHIADESAKDVQAQKDELLQKDFVGQKKCVEWKKDTTEDSKHPFTLNSTKLNDPDAEDSCLRYETITPGGVIGGLVNALITSPVRQLEIANTINQSLDSLFNALINQLATKGFSSLSSFSTQNNQITADYTQKRYYNSFGYLIQVSKTHGGWYSKEGKFDITRDLDDIYTKDTTGNKILVKKGVITLQKDYLEAATDAMKALGPILPAIGKLDYCIPGPNPGWEYRTDEKIAELVEYMKSQSFNGKENSIKPKWVSGNTFGTYTGIGAAVGSVIPGVGTAVGAAVGLAIDIGFSIYDKIQSKKNDSNKAQLEAQYKAAEENFYANQNKQIASFAPQFQSYSQFIHDKYDTITLPTITTFYSDVNTHKEMSETKPNPQYLPMAEAGLDIVKNLDRYDSNVKEAFKDYEDLIEKTKINIRKLEAIKKRVDEIVKGARKRWAKEIAESMNTNEPGKPINWACFDVSLDPALSTGAGANNIGVNPNDFNIDFETPIQDANAPIGSCITKVASDGVVKNGVAPYKYLWKLTTGQRGGSNNGVYTSTDQKTEIKVDAYKDSGDATLELTVEDANGNKATKSRKLNIVHKEEDSVGTECPHTATEPGAPTKLVATVTGDTQVELTWKAPAKTGNATITDYQIEYALFGSNKWTIFSHTASTTPKITVTGLTAGSSYKFRVSAVNSVGAGTASTVVDTRTSNGTTLDFDISVVDSPINTDTNNPPYFGQNVCDADIKITNRNSGNSAQYKWTLSMEHGGNYVPVSGSYTATGTGNTNQPPNPAFRINANTTYGKATVKMEVTGGNGASKTITKTANVTQMKTPPAGHGTTCWY